MIISGDDILKLLKEPLNGASSTKGVSLQKEHKIHITGEGYESLVSKIDGWEDEDDFNIKKQISKPATIQITSIILDNLNRWTSSQGTVKKVDFKDKNKNDLFLDVLNHVWQNNSFDEFIYTFYKEAIYTEFNGFILVTKPKRIDNNTIEREGIIEISNKETLDPYMIFISASDIHDFYLSGDKVEYLIIKLDNENKRYRIIDDEKDVIYEYDKSNDNITEQSYIINELGYVPSRKISSINKKILDSQVKTSPIDHIIPALDRYFSCDVDLRMQFIRHNYPKLAIVTKECNKCEGTGSIWDEDHELECKTCHGSGKVIPIGRDGVIGLPQNLTQGDTAYPGAPASYITPDTQSLQLSIDDLKAQRESIIYSGTGDKNLIAESLNTATENIINSRSLEDRIAEITLMVENFEKFTLKAIKDMHNDFKSIKDYTITVKYGRRISIKGETELSDEIKKSKENGMPSSYIQALQKDLIYAKYKNNDIELERQLLLADLEPFASYTISEIKDIEQYMNKKDLDLKINFDAVIDEFEATQNLLEFAKDKPYKEKIKLIKTQLYAILQERLRPQSLDGSGDLGTGNQIGAKTQIQGVNPN